MGANAKRGTLNPERETQHSTLDIVMTHAVVAIPLRRPGIIDFLSERTAEPRGAAIQILAQRPTPPAEQAWAEAIADGPPTVEDLLAIDDPHGYLVETHTDRLVPVQFLEEPDFLTRSPGGWAPIYFAVAGLPEPRPTGDPLYDHLEVLTDYGDRIPTIDADPQQVTDRLQVETGGDIDHAAASLLRLHRLGEETYAGDPDGHVRRLYRALQGEAPIETPGGRPVADTLLADALLGTLVRVESRRRQARADRDAETAERIAQLQAAWADELGLTLLLKGEYIAGRHRRSTIVIAESLGLVIKQPGLEPRHEIELEARVVDGELENWPRTVNGGAVVTSRGRLRRVLEEDVVPPLHAAFNHGVQFSSLMGVIVEEYVGGPTLREYLCADPDRLTADLYERILATQQVCELLEVDNADWHADNFIVDDDGDLVHIDWGAARPLEDGEKTDTARQERIDQVENLAFSLRDDALADRVSRLHRRLTGDPERMARVRRRAAAMVG